MKFLFSIIFCFYSLAFFSQNWSKYNGIYFIYESISYDTKLKQKFGLTDFTENYDSEIKSYPALKLGYSITGFSNMGISEWALLGVDFGIGLNYNRSIMNALSQYDEPFQTIDFSPATQNNQIFFNYYQPGNQCKINDFGVNLHLDVGSIIYLGAEIDAGTSKIVFLDNRIEDQKVKSLGWFANARIHCGVSIPLPLLLESNSKVNFKAYAVFLGWSARHYKMDWIAGDKKLKNFSTIEANGSPLGLGFSMSILFN